MVDSGDPTSGIGGSTSITRFDPPQLKALHNEDILIHILSFFDPKIFFRDVVCQLKESTRKALLFACLTCRSFVKPASDLLWRYMTSLTPLFHILPTFVKLNDIYTFTGVIQPAHAERFRMYAQKIRALTIKTFLEKIAGHCIHRLLNLYGIQSFFPALKTLDLAASSEYDEIDNYDPLFLVHGTSLSKISISDITSQNGSLMSSFFLHLSDKAPSLRHIDLSGYLPFEILGFLKSFRTLQHVYLSFRASPINGTVLQDLKDLPYLHYLRLDVESHDMGNTASMIRKGASGFQALKSLNLYGPSPSLGKILQCFPEAPELRTIVCCPRPASSATQTSTQECIAEMCRVGRNVDDFTLSGPRPITGILGPASVNSLMPLIQCQQLSSLEISDIAITINDDLIRILCEHGAWRNLSTLQLPPSYNEPPSRAAGLSLTSLRFLAQNCPKLTVVNVPIDFTRHTPWSLEQERRYPRTPDHPLDGLLISKGNFMIHNPGHPYHATEMAATVGRFLEHYFPNIALAELDGDERHCQWWYVVEAVMGQLSSLRREKESNLTL